MNWVMKGWPSHQYFGVSLKLKSIRRTGKLARTGEAVPVAVMANSFVVLGGKRAGFLGFPMASSL